MSDLIENGRVGVVDTRALALSVDEIATLLIAEIHRLKASRVMIDSLSGLELALAPTFRDEYRASMARLVAALASTGATVLLTSELEDRFSDLRFSPSGTAFLTDAIIVQRYIELESRLQRVLAVVKVRARTLTSCACSASTTKASRSARSWLARKGCWAASRPGEGTRKPLPPTAVKMAD